MLSRRSLLAAFTTALAGLAFWRAPVSVQAAPALPPEGDLWQRIPLPGGGAQWLPVGTRDIPTPEIPWHPDVPEQHRRESEPLIFYSPASLRRAILRGDSRLPGNMKGSLLADLVTSRRTWRPHYPAGYYEGLGGAAHAHRDTMQPVSAGLTAFLRRTA